MALTVFAAGETPSAPKDLKLTLAEGNDVVLQWILPTTYADGAAFTGDVAMAKVKVFRNNEEIALLDGPATTYTDKAESESNPDGHGYGLNVYEVCACVDNVWSAPCLPQQILIGEQLPVTALPWEPQLKGLNENNFSMNWMSFDGSWAPDANGVAFASAGEPAVCGWLTSNPDLYLQFLPRRRYVAEFKIEADANVLYSLGLVGYPAPAEGEAMKFIQVIAANRLASADAETCQVEFVYEPKRAGATVWPENVMIAVNACVPAGSGELQAVLSYLKISPVEDASLISPAVSGSATAIEVYNLQGVLLGNAGSLSLEGYAPGLYAVRYTAGNASHWAKILVR